MNFLYNTSIYRSLHINTKSRSFFAQYKCNRTDLLKICLLQTVLIKYKSIGRDQVVYPGSEIDFHMKKSGGFGDPPYNFLNWELKWLQHFFYNINKKFRKPLIIFSGGQHWTAFLYTTLDRISYTLDKNKSIVQQIANCHLK